MKKTLLMLAAWMFLTSCAREEAERQWSALDPNGYRTAEPWQTHSPRPVDDYPEDEADYDHDHHHDHDDDIEWDLWP